MKKFIFPIVLSAILVGELAGITSKNANVNAGNNNTDYFYDSEFVMESGARLTVDKEIAYHGFLLRSDYEMIRKEYTDISFSTVVYPTYYISTYGKVNEDTLFGTNAIYTLDPNDTSKVLLSNLESTVNVTNHNVEIVGNYNVTLLGAMDVEYTGVSLMKAKLYGANVSRLATNNANSKALISLAEDNKNNEFVGETVNNAAKEIIETYKASAGDFNYKIETYINDVKINTETKSAKYGTEVSVTPSEIDGYVFMTIKSNTKGTVLANDKLVLKLYYVANPTYKICYYVMDADANYILCKEIKDLKSRYYEVITLSDEQKKLPQDIVLPVPGYKDDYVYSSSDSIISGVNDGNLELKVCYSVSSRICSYMKRNNGEYRLTKALDNSVPYGYLMCGVFAKTAVVSVTVPKELIQLGGGQPTGGITFTNGTTLPEDNKQGLRNPGDWVAMDVGLHVKGLKTSNNIDQHAYGRCAEINDAAQCKELYYDKTVNVATDPVFIDDKARDLTVVLVNDAFYVYIDDQFVTKFLPDTNSFFMPRDDSNEHNPRFHVGDSYMFGIFMGSFAPTSSRISTVKEVYEADALEEIQTNPRYNNIVLDD